MVLPISDNCMSEKCADANWEFSNMGFGNKILSPLTQTEAIAQSCFLKSHLEQFRKIHRKIPVMDSFFAQVTGLHWMAATA